MKRTLEVLNELEQEGVFTRYAIGGAMAATFYAEPMLTFDLGVFCSAATEQERSHLAKLYLRSIARARLQRGTGVRRNRRSARAIPPSLQLPGRRGPRAGETDRL